MRAESDSRRVELLLKEENVQATARKPEEDEEMLSSGLISRSFPRVL